jgi:hypothetical protein
MQWWHTKLNENKSTISPEDRDTKLKQPQCSIELSCIALYKLVEWNVARKLASSIELLCIAHVQACESLPARLSFFALQRQPTVFSDDALGVLLNEHSSWCTSPRLGCHLGRRKGKFKTLSINLHIGYPLRFLVERVAPLVIGIRRPAGVINR